MKNSVTWNRFKLLGVFLLSVFFIFVKDITIAISIFLIGLVIFLLTKKTKAQVTVSLGAFATGVMMLIYNIIFSPREHGGVSWFIFTVNSAGFDRGLIMALRLVGVMLVSFSWLFSTSIYQMYESLSWIKPIQPWILVFFRGLQIFRSEIQSIVRSLLIRGLKWNSLISNIKNLIPLASVIIPRSLNTAQESTLAFLTHMFIHGGKNVR